MPISTFTTLAKRELEGRPGWCLDLTFQHALLVLGYEFGDDREVQLGKRIEGTELGWCLGATIAMYNELHFSFELFPRTTMITQQDDEETPLLQRLEQPKAKTPLPWDQSWIILLVEMPDFLSS
ncbi:uncharacterized protein F5147DRAFT_840430 [Suillus discolor]|uniref:Uncharacterized protein n=1 Tax=Suillus discolor TaxID=1912936 RepID=A0A9P7JP42_9AGAM|nr:uncharacterized protein F5147DRAFT_840430 [Suillus discolor]KAG2093750.1 hypothetical protein F5147DRAFT_840430 [Suillus discolor]